MRSWINWAGSLALLGAALWFLDWQLLAVSVSRLTLLGFLVAVLLASALFGALLARWHLMMGSPSGWERYTCGARYLHANLLNAVSPGNLGGDIYRYFAFRTTERSGLALVTLLVQERVLGLASMLIGLLVGVVGMELADHSAARPLAAGVWRTLGAASFAGLATLAVLPWLLERLPVKNEWLSRLRATLTFGGKGRTAAVLGWSLLALALWIACVQHVALQLGLDVPWFALVATVTSVELVRVVPITVQGLGLREGTFATLLGLSGYAPESGFVLGAVAYLALSAALVLTGALGAAMLSRGGARR